jgi:nitrite reductase/ring-hydroxylating ferredoxin subunit
MSSYPFKAGPTFARNQWYLAAWSDEVGDAVLARTILGEDLILRRTSSGDVAALSGVCPHRWMPLAGAQVVEDAVVCPYHGARFGPGGQCVSAPMQDRVPPRFGLKSYPVVEQAPCIWIWPGDPALADAALIPDAASVGLTAGWRIEREPPRRMAARAQLLIENLFDQSHVDVVHPSTLGGAASHGDPGQQQMADLPHRFSVTRLMPPTPADDGVRAVFPEIGDYLMALLRVELLGVGLINSTGSQTFATDASGGSPRLVGEMNFLHGVTPETATSTHYFTAVTRNFAVDSDAFSAALLERNARVVLEDIVILEAIERRIDVVGDPRAETSFASDAGAVQVRRRLEKLIAEETATERVQTEP